MGDGGGLSACLAPVPIHSRVPFAFGGGHSYSAAQIIMHSVVSSVRARGLTAALRPCHMTAMPLARCMSSMPTVKPASPNFSSGPCAKRPGYALEKLAGAPLGRSHRAKIGKAKLAGAIDETRALLEEVGLPKDYLIGIVPGSDTGAVEMAMWSLLGPKPVTMVHFEAFGGDWFTDVTKQLKLENVTNLKADYGVLPDLDAISWGTDDVVFTYNGTTSGVRVPPSFAPPADRAGLAICDATSAVFAMDMPWSSLDVITFSWQKCLGGEGAHGMLILSPKAVERIESCARPPASERVCCVGPSAHHLPARPAARALAPQSVCGASRRAAPARRPRPRALCGGRPTLQTRRRGRCPSCSA